MTKITDMIEIHDGVALMIGRHDDARGPNITPRGAMFAYGMGKYGAEHFRIDPPELIVHSPVSRTRNTALMHRNAMLVNEMGNPEMMTDMRLHEQAGGEALCLAAEEAIRYAANMGYKTVEIITHSDSPFTVAGHFGGVDSNGLSYGGMVVLKADSWEDMLAKKTYGQQDVNGSEDLARAVLGSVAVDVLNVLSAPDNTLYLNALYANEEAQKIWQEAGLGKHSELDEKLNAIINAKEKESVEWVLKALKGEDVDSVVAPNEFMQMYDAYKYWVQNMALAVGINPYESTDGRLFDENGEFKDNRGRMQSKMMDKLAGLDKRARTISAALSDDDQDYLHPILNAAVQKMEKGRFTERKGRVAGHAGSIGLNVPGYTDIMQPEKFSPEYDAKKQGSYQAEETEDHPLLNALLAAKMRAEARKAAEAKEDAEKTAKTSPTVGNTPSVKDMIDSKINGGKE